MFQGGEVKTVPGKRANSDYSLKGAKSKGGPEYVDRLIRNTYKVLLTRGQKGCFVYCEDEALREFLRDKLSQR